MRTVDIDTPIEVEEAEVRRVIAATFAQNFCQGVAEAVAGIAERVINAVTGRVD